LRDIETSIKSVLESVYNLENILTGKLVEVTRDYLALFIPLPLKSNYLLTYSRSISVLRSAVHWCRWSNGIQSRIIRINRKAGS